MNQFSSMLDDDELDDLLQLLDDEDPALRAATLQTLIASPAADARLVKPVAQLLSDRTPVVVSVPPPRIGEIRWLAATALSVLRRALDVAEPVVLPGAVEPLDAAGIAAAAHAASLHVHAGIDGALEAYAALARKGVLPAADRVVNDR